MRACGVSSARKLCAADKWTTWSRLLQLRGLHNGRSALCQEGAPSLLEAARVRPAPKRWHVLSIRAPGAKNSFAGFLRMHINIV